MNWAQDSIDVHVHAAPSIFERWGSAWDLAEACRDAGMAGFVVKAHHGSTVEMASILNDQFPELQIFGGISLNYYVGGLNPYAAETALRLGGKIMWLPTVHAVNHGECCGMLGGFGFQGSKVLKVPEQGIRICDETGQLDANLKEILTLLHDQNMVLASGHLSPQEIHTLIRYIETNQLNIKLLLNHVFFKTSEFSVSQLKELVRDWVWFETVYLCISPLVNCASIETIAGAMQALPDARWIVATDSGQKNNLKCPDALNEFSRQLIAQGVPAERLSRMLRDEPRALLELSSTRRIHKEKDAAECLR